MKKGWLRRGIYYRHFIRSMVVCLLLLVACSTQIPLARATRFETTPEEDVIPEEQEGDATENDSPEPLLWSYTGASSPDYWQTLAPEFAVCGIGKHQSPINIERAHVQHADYALQIDYRETPVALLNNGRTIQFNYAPGSGIIFAGTPYTLVQFHFHQPSEHRVDGELADMELHLVHQDAADNFAVIGLLIMAGKPNAVVEPFWGKWSRGEGEVALDDVIINIGDILPPDQSLYVYNGSLTTPPCTEGVQWFMMQHPIEFSQAQIAVYTEILANTNRPVQPLNGRVVYAVERRS
jgi:carbonic anhydrase